MTRSPKIGGFWLMREYEGALLLLTEKCRRSDLSDFDRPDLWQHKESVPSAREIAEEALRKARKARKEKGL